jgi:hypothetical protein
MLQQLCNRIRDEEIKVIQDAQYQVERLAGLLRGGGDDEVPGTVVDAQSEYDEARQHLQSVLETHANYPQDTQFDRFVQQSEGSTSYFFRPPVAHLRRTPTQSVMLQDGTESADANVFSLEFGAHWGCIMDVGEDTTPSAMMRAAQDQLLGSVTRTLNNDQQTSFDSFDSPLSAAEIKAAIKFMSAHKAPGPDVFTAAFYQTAPTAFAKILLQVFKCAPSATTCGCPAVRATTLV